MLTYRTVLPGHPGLCGVFAQLLVTEDSAIEADRALMKVLKMVDALVPLRRNNTATGRLAATQTV